MESRPARRRNRIEKNLTATLTALSEAQAIAHLGSWELNRKSNRLTWSDETFRIFGVDRGTFAPTYDTFLERTHPEDREAVEKVYAHSVANHEVFDVEHRILMDDGAAKFVHERGKTFYDAEGHPVRSVGVVLDITERRAVEHALEQSERKYRNLVESSYDIIWEIDADAVITFVNPATRTVIGYSPEELIGKLLFAVVLHPDEVEKIKMIMATGQPFAQVETSLLRKDGSTVVVETSATPLFDGNRLVGYHGILRDISARKLAETQLASALALSRAATWEYDVQTNLFTFNDNFYQIYGTTAEKVGGYTMSPDEYSRRFVYPDDIPVVAGETQLALQSPDPHFTREIEHRFIKANGEIGFLAVRILTVKDTSGRTIKTYGVNQDITELRRTEQELTRFKLLGAAAIEASIDGILITDAHMQVISVNEAFAKMWGITPEQVSIDRSSPMQTQIDQVKDPDGFAARLKYLYEHPGEMAHDVIEFKDGRIFDRDSVCLYDENGKYMGRTWTYRDITERKAAEATIMEMARYDALTGLANRHVFVEELNYAIARARRSDKSFAVLYLDLDHFKDVNDTLGHPIGDDLLKAVGQRLRANMREIDTVARFGGDEFAVVMSELADPADAAVLAEKLLKCVAEPFGLRGNEIRTGTSIGIATYGPDTRDAETLLTQADVALYRAKTEGRGTYRFFTDAMDREVKARVALDGELREALAAEQFTLYFQPEVEIDTGRILGLEALVRWRHPGRGLLGPAEFIPAAEKSGLIVALGRWVLRDACRQAREWLDMGVAPGFVAVNLSILQFKSTQDLEKDVAEARAEFRLPPRMLEFELTETVLMDATRGSSNIVQRLRDQGVRIAIDDFGTGYSSLEYLRRLSVDRIKIAQAFVTDLDSEASSGVIVRAALGLARELGLGVIAEGVETEAQLELLRSWGCREVQGFYFAEPRPAQEITKLLRQGRILRPAPQLPSPAEV